MQLGEGHSEVWSLHQGQVGRVPRVQDIHHTHLVIDATQHGPATHTHTRFELCVTCSGVLRPGQYKTNRDKAMGVSNTEHRSWVVCVCVTCRALLRAVQSEPPVVWLCYGCVATSPEPLLLWHSCHLWPESHMLGLITHTSN